LCAIRPFLHLIVLSPTMKFNFCFVCSLLFLLLLFSCRNKGESGGQDVARVLSGDFAKLWVFKSRDSFDCHCYYAMIYRSGRMNYMLREKFTGTFTNYFNNWSGDVINNDRSWSYRHDTLTLIGFPYIIRSISTNRDTVFLKSVSGTSDTSNYYLIDSKLIDSGL